MEARDDQHGRLAWVGRGIQCSSLTLAMTLTLTMTLTRTRTRTPALALVLSHLCDGV